MFTEPEMLGETETNIQLMRPQAAQEIQVRINGVFTNTHHWQ